MAVFSILSLSLSLSLFMDVCGFDERSYFSILSPAHSSMLVLSRFVVVLDDIHRSFMHGFCCILLHHHEETEVGGMFPHTHTKTELNHLLYK